MMPLPSPRTSLHVVLIGIGLMVLQACQQGPEPLPLFVEATGTGLDFVHVNGMTGQKYFVEMAGAGAALFDYDADGDLDLYLVQGGSIGPAADGKAGTEANTVYQDRLYRNDLSRNAQGQPVVAFVDVTEASGIRATGYGMGVATGDVDGDGYPDLYVLNWGANQLWRNNGDGTFTDITQPGLTDDPRWSAGATFFDYDRDGRQDLFVVNYVAYRLENDHPCFAARSGRRDYCGPQSYKPEPDRLLHNLGGGRFEEVTLQTGLAQAYGAGLGAVAADLNRDGWPDLYVANDGMENQMWINHQGARFENEALLQGTAFNMSGAAEASMGVTAADFDHDGDEDLFMTHLNGETNTFYLNTGEGRFEDASRRSGLGQPSWPYTAFGTAALDADLDGWLDVFVANGEVRIIPTQADAGDPLPLRQPNQLFRNLGGGRFEEVPAWLGEEEGPAEVSRGVAVGDLDNDGDADLVVANNNGPVRLLMGTASRRASWVGLVLEDGKGRIQSGARVMLRRADGVTLWRRSHTDGGYASAHDPRILLALGPADGEARVEVLWPDGSAEAWTGLAPNQYHTLVKGTGVAATSAGLSEP